ncbi:unnamed protein product [Camellia sinensis]
MSVPFRDEFNVLLERAKVLHLEKVEGLQKVYHRLYSSGSFNKLTELTIEDCKLKYLFSPSCARGLLQIQELVIRDCAVMEGIVGNEGEKNEEAATSEAINFSQLKYMELESLPSLVSFYPKMEKTSTAKENSSTQAHSLFNEKVMFPALEQFYISELPKLTEIWDRKLPPSESFKKLRDVNIWSCEKLVNVGLSNMPRQLPKLRKLHVAYCQELKVVVLENGEENEKAENNTNTISFPQLTGLSLVHLESLKSFCTSRSERQSLFTSQVAFPILEDLKIEKLPNIIEIWDTQLLIASEEESKSFCQLKDMTVSNCEKLVHVVEFNMLPRLQNLKKFNVDNCPRMEAIVSEKDKEEGTTRNDIIVFSQLTTLNLSKSVRLKSFYNWPTRSKAQPLFNHQVAFPVLEDLKIEKLPNIIEIWDTQLLIASEEESKSFCQLKDMTVSNCEKLVHVVEFNMFPRLQNLKKFNVDNCPRMEATVSEKEKEEATTRNDIIVFSQLTTLNLSKLARLKSFYNWPTRSKAQPLFNHQDLKIEKLPNIIEIWDTQLLIASEEESKSFCQLKDMTVSNCEKLVHVVEFNMLPRLQNLKKFNVDNCPRMEAIVSEKEKEEGTTRNDIIVFSQLTTLNLSKLARLKSFYNWPTKSEAQPLFNHQVAFLVLEDLELQELPNIIEIWDKQLVIASEEESKSFYQLKDMKVSNCEKLVHVVQFNMLSRLQNLETFNVDHCPKMEAIVSEKGKEEGTTSNDIIVFSQLTTLNLSVLVGLKSFYNWPTRSDVQPLFNHKVAFPVLKDLKIEKLPNIIEIWDTQLLIASEEESKSFCQLKDMTVSNCEKLVHVVEFNMLPRLQNLKKFNVDNCPRMEAIVSEKEKKEGTTRNDIIVFSQLTTLNLSKLVSLKSFYNWPTRSEAQPLFNHQVAFPVLEYLEIQKLPNIREIWDKLLLIASEKESMSFCQLKDMKVSKCEKLVHVVEFNMLPRLQNLKKFNVGNCPRMEVIVSEKEKEEGTTSNDPIVFSQLTTLSLSKLVSLKMMSGRGRGARRGRPARQEVPLPEEVPAVQEGVGQANVAEPMGQQAMGALAREIAGALGILRAGNQVAEAGPCFLKREFFRSNPDEFVGDPKEPLKADEWLEQMSKTFEMLAIEDGALKVTLASFQLKGDAGQWWKYEKTRVGGTWEAFVNAFQERFLSAAAREKLRDQFSRLNQQGLSVAEFEATFTSLSRFAPELVASEERRCFEFERKLRRGLKLRIGGSYIREYRHLVDAAAHMEIMMQEEDEGQRGFKRSQDGQGDGRRQRGSNPQQSQGGVARSTFPVPSAGSGRGGQGEFTCYKCGQPGHKVSVFPLKGGGQRAASSSARPQSQSSGRGQPLSFYQCGQPGHLKRFCPQLSATSGASGSRQTQGFQPAQSVQASRANPGASSSQSVQQSFAPRGEQVDQGPTGRVYAVTAPDLVPAPSVVRG